MFNVLLDRLPDKWRGYRIEAGFRTGIQIMQCLSDEEFPEEERLIHTLILLFPCGMPETEEALEGLKWFLSEFSHDNHSEKSETDNVKVYDFDIDQWRIYSAFLNQYGIDLNTAKMHWFTFMGLLSDLEECAFTRVVDIRIRKPDKRAGTKEKRELEKIKEVYRIGDKDAHLTPEQKRAEQRQLEIFNNFMNAGKKQ